MESIDKIFNEYPGFDIILTGIYDGRTRSGRFWEFGPNGLNMFERKAIFLKDGTEPPKTRSELYRLLANKPFINYRGTEVNIESEIDKDPLEIRKEKHKKDLKEYLKYKFIFVTVYPKRKILIVGNKHEAISMGYRFAVMDWEVDYEFTSPNNKIKRKLTDNNFDHILIIHNYDAIDVSEITVPVHYYAKRGVHPSLPINWNGKGIFFHAYLGAVEQYRACHPFEMGSVGHAELVPHAWDPLEFLDLGIKRDIFFGFMGTLGRTHFPYDDERRDYLTVHIRDLRAKYIASAKSFGLKVFEKSTRKEYNQFLNRCSLVLNVSGIFGWIDERQYHAMGCGAVLVQNYYKYLDVLGYKDKVNCLLFKDKWDLWEHLKWARDNPTELEKVRARGKLLATNNKLFYRVEQMVKAMLREEKPCM